MCAQVMLSEISVDLIFAVIQLTCMTVTSSQASIQMSTSYNYGNFQLVNSVRRFLSRQQLKNKLVLHSAKYTHLNSRSQREI